MQQSVVLILQDIRPININLRIWRSSCIKVSDASASLAFGQDNRGTQRLTLTVNVTFGGGRDVGGELAEAATSAVTNMSAGAWPAGQLFHSWQLIELRVYAGSITWTVTYSGRETAAFPASSKYRRAIVLFLPWRKWYGTSSMRWISSVPAA
jgi:hypothetical protein